MNSMNPFYRLRSLQNKLSFAIRSQVRLSLPVKSGDDVIERSLILQREFQDFVRLFDWSFLEKEHKNFIVTDVGARDFSFAPVIDAHFRGLGFHPEVHGVEIDAFRRYSNLRSRADYGRYFAEQIPRGVYHAMDFLKWQRRLDACFLLHPFVTPEPPVRWGLSLSHFKPQEIFDHAYKLLHPRSGLMLLSCPTMGEFDVAVGMAKRAGFTFGEIKSWHPSADTAHRKPRYGILLHTF
jgi:hypothetical protein